MNKLQTTWMTALLLAIAFIGLAQPSPVNAKTETPGAQPPFAVTTSAAQPAGERVVRVVYPSPYGR
jgi:hypothetical protein